MDFKSSPPSGDGLARTFSLYGDRPDITLRPSVIHPVGDIRRISRKALKTPFKKPEEPTRAITE